MSMVALQLSEMFCIAKTCKSWIERAASTKRGTYVSAELEHFIIMKIIQQVILNYIYNIDSTQAKHF